jgi:hypothetical protein
MGKAKTASFWLATTVAVDSNTPATATIDLSQYVDAGDRQGLLIEQADFIFYDATNNCPWAGTSHEFAVQIKDTTTANLVDYDSEHLVGSAGLIYDTVGGVSTATDLFPDDMGWSKGEGRIVINGSLEIMGKADSAAANMECAVRIRGKVITLNSADYMSIALQSLTD